MGVSWQNMANTQIYRMHYRKNVRAKFLTTVYMHQAVGSLSGVLQRNVVLHEKGPWLNSLLSARCLLNDFRSHYLTLW